MALSLALKAVGAAQQAAVAAVLGAGPAADAYAAAFALPNLLIALLVFGPLSLALTTAVASDAASEDGLRLASTALSWSMAGAVALTVTGIAAAPLLVALLAPGLPPEAAAQSAALLRIMAPAVGCAAVAAALRGLLHGWGLFAAPLLAYLLAAVLLLAATALLVPVWGVAAAPWAALAGAVMGLAGQSLIVRRRVPGLRPLAVWRHPKLAGMAGLLLLTSLALAAGPAMALAARMAASSLGPGALAHVEYALSFDRLIGGVGAASVAAVHYPALARLRAQGDRAGLVTAAGAALRSAAFLSAAMAAGAAALAGPLVRTWLLRGQFGAEDAAAVALLAALLAPALLAWAMLTPLLYVFHALGRMRAPALTAAAGVAFTLALAQAGGAAAGLPGVAAGCSAGAAVTAAALGLLLVRTLDAAPVLALRSAGAALLAGCAAGPAAALALAIPDTDLLPWRLVGDALRLVMGAAFGTAAALAAGGALGLPEARRVWRRAADALRPAATAR